MKRHKSLHPLSQHHHFALIETWRINKALETSEGERSNAVRKTAEAFVRFYRAKGYLHFREEEEVLLPVYARHVRLDENKAVMRMLADHATIRGLVEDVEQLLEKGGELQEKIAVLAKLLHDHVRLEENEIFPQIEEALSEEELHAVAPHLHRLHSKNECEI